MKKKEDMASKQRRNNFEARPLGEENIIDFHTEGFTLFINGGGRTEPSPVQIPNPQKVHPHPRFSVNRSA